MIKACIFDLDGVLVDTIDLHFASWQTLAMHLGNELPSSMKDEFRGASRMKSLQIILNKLNITATDQQKLEYCEIKNDAYLYSLKHISNEILLPGALDLLESLSRTDIKLGLASASKNAKNIVTALGINNYFHTMVDANDVIHTKPNPEVFYTAAKNLNCKPSESLIFEDSPLGIEAALTGGFKSVGIGNKAKLNKAHMNILTLENISIKMIRNFCKN